MIIVNEQEKVFHLNNGRISYLFYVMESGQLGHLYFGKALTQKGSYLHMVEKVHRPMTTYITEGDLYTSYEHLRQEYPCYGTSDYRYPAMEIQGRDGSREHIAPAPTHPTIAHSETPRLESQYSCSLLGSQAMLLFRD